MRTAHLGAGGYNSGGGYGPGGRDLDAVQLRGEALLPPRGQTDTCENITFPQPRLQVVKIGRALRLSIATTFKPTLFCSSEMQILT